MDGLNLENALNLFNMLSMIDCYNNLLFCMFVSISHLIKPPHQTLHRKKHPIGSGKERITTEDQPSTKRQQPNAQIGAFFFYKSKKKNLICT
jgi:hypothetical protein